MKDFKESNPVEVIYYEVGNNLSSEPAFSWCLSNFLKKQDQIIVKLKSDYWHQTPNFGIEAQSWCPRPWILIRISVHTSRGRQFRRI